MARISSYQGGSLKRSVGMARFAFLRRSGSIARVSDHPQILRT
jgi:hypothetical protein